MQVELVPEGLSGALWEKNSAESFFLELLVLSPGRRAASPSSGNSGAPQRSTQPDFPISVSQVFPVPALHLSHRPPLAEYLSITDVQQPDLDVLPLQEIRASL